MDGSVPPIHWIGGELWRGESTGSGGTQALPGLASHGPEPGVAFNDAFGDGVASQTGHIVNPKFVHHLLAVLLDRLDTNAQFGRDLLVGPPLGNQLEHFGLASREIIRPFSKGYAADEGLAALIPQPFGNGRAKKS